MKLPTIVALSISLGLSTLSIAQDNFQQLGGPSPQISQRQAPNTLPGQYQGGAPMMPQGQGQGQMGQAPAMPAQQGAQGGMGFGGGGGGGNPALMQQLQMLLQAETQDYGIPPQNELRRDTHGPTPTAIPGGQLITTDHLLNLYQQHQQSLLVFHVLGPGPMLPMAQQAAPASQPGSFNDQVQQEFGNWLQQLTQGDQQRPMVFYCQGTYCWMSYNAALRAIHLGYRQVYWYRGGVEAWSHMQQLSMQMQGQMPQAGPGGMATPQPPPQPQHQQYPGQMPSPATGGQPGGGWSGGMNPLPGGMR